MNGLPYYKAYPRDFMEGTIGMPFELKAAYRLVLDLIYMQAGRLPDDAKYISAHLGCSVRAWNIYRQSLIKIGKIQSENGFISNFRATLEVDKLEIFSDKQRKNGSEPKKNNMLGKAMAKPRPSHTEPDTEEEKREPIGSTKKSSRRCKLPEGWVPSERNISDAQSKNLSIEEISHEADKFRNHHASKGTVFADWDAGWRTWLGNAPKFAASSRLAIGTASSRNGQGGSIASIVARRRASGEV